MIFAVCFGMIFGHLGACTLCVNGLRYESVKGKDFQNDETDFYVGDCHICICCAVVARRIKG